MIAEVAVAATMPGVKGVFDSTIWPLNHPWTLKPLRKVVLQHVPQAIGRIAMWKYSLGVNVASLT